MNKGLKNGDEWLKILYKSIPLAKLGAGLVKPRTLSFSKVKISPKAAITAEQAVVTFLPVS